MVRPDDFTDDEERSDHRAWLWLVLGLGLSGVALIVTFSVMLSASAAGGCGGG